MGFIKINTRFFLTFILANSLAINFLNAEDRGGTIQLGGDWSGPDPKSENFTKFIFFGGDKIPDLRSSKGINANTTNSVVAMVKLAGTEIIGFLMAEKKDNKLLMNIESLISSTSEREILLETLNLKFKGLEGKIELLSDHQGIVGLKAKDGIDLDTLTKGEKALMEEIEAEIKEARVLKEQVATLTETVNAGKEEIKEKIASKKIKIPAEYIGENGLITEEGAKYIRDNSYKLTKLAGKGLMILGVVELGGDTYRLVWRREMAGIVPGSSTYQAVKDGIDALGGAGHTTEKPKPE